MILLLHCDLFITNLSMSDTEPILSPPDLKEAKNKGAAVKEMQKILAGKRMAQQQAQVSRRKKIKKNKNEKIL